MSNYSRHPVTIRGKEWPTTEHFFQVRDPDAPRLIQGVFSFDLRDRLQAMKFEGTDMEETIRRKPEPAVAKKLGQSPGLRADWDQVRDAIMKEAVLAKFTQHQDLQLRLLKTGDALLVEHTKNDAYWGDGALPSRTAPRSLCH